MTTTGDVIYSSPGSTPVRLPIGSAGELLTVSGGGIPSWATAPSTIPASATASVATSETTTSTSYVALTTAGPAVTVTTGTKALVIITGNMRTTTSGGFTYMSYSVSGATTISAADATNIELRQSTSPGVAIRASSASLVTLTAGSNTFTALYKVSATATGTFFNRDIFVMNLA
jgi:hypothetical protein